MRTLHVDSGREMAGGQWQVLYLIERFPGAALMVPEESPLRRHFRGSTERLSITALRRCGKQFDLVHAHDAKSHTMAAMAGISPLVVSRRVGFPVRQGIASRWKYSRADRYLAVSKYVAERMEEAGVEAKKIRVVYDGVPVPEPGNPAPGRVVALKNKGRGIVEQAAKSLGIEIHFISNLWRDLSTASVFVYASEMEGLGSAALAAMASGVPVIASDVGGLPEIVEHECTGLIVQNDQMAGAIARLLDDPALAAAMGRRGRERVIENFSVEKMVERTEQAYREVLGW